MHAISLQSGSNGNCYYVEADGTRLLFDAGLSGRRTRQRLAACDRDIQGVDALIISHDHSDHVRNAGVLHRMYDLPLHITGPTLAKTRQGLGKLGETREFCAGDTLEFGAVRVETLPTPHDAEDGTAFVICAGDRRLGILTDLGHPFRELIEVIPTLDGVFIESNYDPEMLDRGPYPAFLKNRIRGEAGHISNEEAAGLLQDCASDRLRWACLSHLSDNNNTPEIALETHRRLVSRQLQLHVATRHRPSSVLRV
jgi:phosphoribosyl 1,2-cyclic phosphodiesterase